MTPEGITLDKEKDQVSFSKIPPESCLKWKTVATEKQKFYFEFFKNHRWEFYDKSQFLYLKAKIGYALFGPPVSVEDTIVENFYTKSQKRKLEEIFTALKKVPKIADSFSVGLVYLIAYIDREYTEFPVWKVLKEEGDNDYEVVDSYGYVYKTWDKFIKTNVFPGGIYCYPKNGFYVFNQSGDLELGFKFFNRGNSILTGIVSQLSVAIPGSKPDQHTISCGSVIKGIIGRNRNCWIPVRAVSGSAYIYAVHTTHSIAESSQKTQNIPRVITEALKFGYIKINWYSVLNYIKCLIPSSGLITRQHVSQVVAIILFFCNTFVTSETAKALIKEIRFDINKNSPLILNKKQNIILRSSLSITGKRGNVTQLKYLKYINDREGIVNAITEKPFQTHFMIPDQHGNYYMLEKLIENLGSSDETRKYADIITNYCLILEETIRNCSNCNKAIEDNSKFIEILNLKVDNIMLEEREIRRKNTSGVNATSPKAFTTSNNVSPYVTLDQTAFTNCESSMDIPAIGCGEISNKNDWLIQNIFNYHCSSTPPELLIKENHLGSQDSNNKIQRGSNNYNEDPPLTPASILNSAKQMFLNFRNQNVSFDTSCSSLPPQLLIKGEEHFASNPGSQDPNNKIQSGSNNYEDLPLTPASILNSSNNIFLSCRNKNVSFDTDCSPVPPKPLIKAEEHLAKFLKSDDSNNKIQNEYKSYGEDSTLTPASILKSANQIFLNCRNLCREMMEYGFLPNGDSPRVEDMPNTASYDFSHNVNTPEHKKDNKKHVFSSNTFSNKIVEERKESKKMNNKRDVYNTRVRNCLKEDYFPVQSSSETNVSDSNNMTNYFEDSLVGEVSTFVREINPFEKLEPLDYFSELVEVDFKKCTPLVYIDHNKTDSWQFIINKEINRVKLIKIEIKKRKGKKEWVMVTYY